MLYIKPQDHCTREVHPSQRQHHVKPISQPLYVACAITNPQRYYTRYKLYQAFEKHMEESGVILYTIELALRDRHFEVTSPDNPRNIQLRSTSELWHKENLLNIAISRFPEDWHYGAWIDGDVLMSRPDWATETVHQLQHYDWVQVFSTQADLDANFNTSKIYPSFVYAHKNKNVPDSTLISITQYDKTGVGRTGLGWAFRRDAFDKVGGLLDICILGSADWHMALALIGKTNLAQEIKFCSKQYVEAIQEWSDRATGFEHKIGYVDNLLLHYYHGDKKDRQYNTRWEILKKFDFDPKRDIKKDWQSVLKWVGNKPALEEAVRNYFRTRNEDK